MLIPKKEGEPLSVLSFPYKTKPMAEQNINVLIIDDHELMIQGLRSLLEDEESISSINGASTLEEALALIGSKPIDVILMDINMPEISGIEATRIVKKSYPKIKIIALTMHDDISIITKMFKAGASGYILKRTKMTEVVEAIKTVFHNDKFLSANTQDIVMKNFLNPAEILQPEDEKSPVLSKRELEVLKLIAKEYSNQEIGNKLFISERTVEAHRRNIFIKTKTKSVVGLIKYAIQNDLINIEK